MVWIRVNDVFEELSDENKRLLNELILANKCLNVLIRFKTFIDFISDKFEISLNSNESQKYEELRKNVDEVIKDKNISKTNSENEIQFISSPETLPSKNSLKNKSKANPKKTKTGGKAILLRPMKQKLEIDSNGNDEQNTIKEKITQKLNQNRIPKKKTLRVRYVCDLEAINGLKYKSNLFLDFIGCGKDFRTKRELRNHLRLTHGQDLYRRHRCEYEECKFRSFYAHELKDHMNIHNGVQPYECDSCGQTFCEKKLLRHHFKSTHQTIHKTEKQLICEFCNKQFKTEASIRSHQKYIHFEGNRFQCNHENCEYKCGTRYKLNQHILCKHTTERHFKCTYEGCDKTFKTELVQKQHENIHKGNGFVRCQHCQRILRTCSLYTHLERQHSGKKYSCEWPGCDYTGNNPGSLKRHRFVHSTECNFTCDWPQCAKTFKKKMYLDRHLRIHNNDKKYGCSWPGCSYRCTDSGNLIKHRRIHLKK